jgi:hypothetical protein
MGMLQLLNFVEGGVKILEADKKSLLQNKKTTTTHRE